MSILSARTLCKAVMLRSYVQLNNCILLYPFAFVLDSIFAYQFSSSVFLFKYDDYYNTVSITERFPVFTEWNDVHLVFKWKVHLKLYVFYDRIFGKVGKNVYRKRQEWENIHPIVNRDYLPDRVEGSWSGSMVVPWLLFQGSYRPVVEKDVATSNYTTMF